ncbi:MAG: tyrosine-type recombinase/integrase [Pirellulales bacterium]
MRTPKMYWKSSHKSFYVNVGGKQHRLGADEDVATKEYHRLLAGEIPVTSKTTVAVLATQFLEWTKDNRSLGTWKWYKFHIDSFTGHSGTVKVDDIKANHVTRWLAAKFDHTSDNHKNGACRAVSRMFNWAIKQGLLASNPVATMERPSSTPREDYLTVAQWQKFIGSIKVDDPLHDLATFLWETGCRPHEARIAEAKHFDRAGRRIVLERKNSKGKKVRRVVRLNETAFEIVNRRALKGGYIFTNRIGNPWTASGLVARFEVKSKLCKITVFPYILRHSFVTHTLMRGVDPITVAALAGHCDGNMIARVYAHVAQDEKYLAAKLRQATEDVA